MHMFLLGLILGIGIVLAYQQIKHWIPTSDLVAYEPRCICYNEPLEAMARSMCKAPGAKDAVYLDGWDAIMVHPATTIDRQPSTPDIDYW